MMNLKPHKRFMNIAIEEARIAASRGDYAIGACIVKGDQVIARGGNRVKTKGDSTKHVELELIQYVVGMHPTPYISDCVLYSTHEPCPMCSGAGVWARLGGIVFGAHISDMEAHTDEDRKFRWRAIPINCRDVIKGRDIALVEGFMRDECWELFDLSK